jgi:DHA1 family multidrug resistance protein-like MFS transporter
MRFGARPTDDPAAVAKSPMLVDSSSSPGWRVNYAALLFAQLVSSATFGPITPFLPLHMIELGEDQAAAIVWVGAISTGMGIMQLLANPLWGAVADRFGRKAVVVRALLGSAIFLGGLFFTRAVWQVFAIRVVQGALSAPNAALLALATSILPTAQMGAGLGMLQTVQFVGSSTAR